MAHSTSSLRFVYDGWDGYNKSLVEAVKPLTPEQLDFRSHPDMRSVREVFWHISQGRVDWFIRIQAPHSQGLQEEMSQVEDASLDSTALAHWLDRTWEMVDAVLEQWDVEDIAETYNHEYQGVTYAVSRQWTIWRILTHDVHHGGQISEMLAARGIQPLELTLLGGHLTEPEVAKG